MEWVNNRLPDDTYFVLSEIVADILPKLEIDFASLFDVKIHAGQAEDALCIFKIKKKTKFKSCTNCHNQSFKRILMQKRE